MGKNGMKYLVSGTLCALALSVASPALALDPQPKTYRDKQRHTFRDVQLGLTHPAPETQVRAADQQAASLSHRAKPRQENNVTQVARRHPAPRGGGTPSDATIAINEQATTGPATGVVR